MKEQNKRKKLSIFQTTSIVLIGLMIAFIIISVGIIIDLKNKIDDTKEKNDAITNSIITNEKHTKIEEKYLKNIIKFI